MGTKLPRKLEQKMRIVGEQIKLARLRRNLSIAQITERATCSPLTISHVKKKALRLFLSEYIYAFYMLCNWTRIFYSLQKKTQLAELCKT